MDRDFSSFPLSPAQIYNVNRQAGESCLLLASCCVRRQRRPPAPFVDLWRPRLFACPLYGHRDGIRLRISLLSLQLKSFSFIYLNLFILSLLFFALCLMAWPQQRVVHGLKDGVQAGRTKESRECGREIHWMTKPSCVHV